jgi:hypothetical protein
MGFSRSAVDIEEARTVWESMERPSAAKVVKHFKEVEGKVVNIATINKWYKNNWIRGNPGRKYANPIKEIEKLLPLLTGRTVGQIHAQYVKDTGGEMSEAEVFDLAAADMANFLRGLIASQSKMMEVMSRADPKGFSELVKATTSIAQAVHVMHNQNNAIKRKTIDLVPDKETEDEALDSALAAWTGASNAKTA